MKMPKRLKKDYVGDKRSMFNYFISIRENLEQFRIKEVKEMIRKLTKQQRVDFFVDYIKDVEDLYLKDELVKILLQVCNEGVKKKS